MPLTSNLRKMKRGFKARCEQIVAEVREGLGLPQYAPFDPFAYAESLCVPCMPVSLLPGCTEETLVHVAGIGRKDFSAVTVYREERAIVVYNDHNIQERQRSDVTHELSHVTLEHEPRPVFGEGGCRAWDKEQEGQEKEAAWLSGALLVPAEIALEIARSRTPIEEAASIYGVSVPLMRYRLNMSGALIRAKREGKGA